MLALKGHQAVFLVQPYLPLLLLCLRLLVVVVVATLLLLPLLYHDMGKNVLAVAWSRFSVLTELPADQRAAPLAHGGAAQDEEILNQDPNYPRIRNTLMDHIFFSFYDGDRVYSNEGSVNGQVARKPHADERLMLSQVRERAMQYLDNKYPERYKQEHCKSIRYRTLPTVGLEVDMTCRDPEGHVDRVSLLKPFTPPRVLYHHALALSRSLNIIMPLRGRYPVFQLFLENLKEVLKTGGPVSLGLTVVYFDDDQGQKVQDLLQKVGQETPGLETDFILLEKSLEFSRGLGLQEGMERTKLKGEVLFFCDVDAFFTREFLTRCLATPVQDHQVYAPMVFSLYNPEFVYPLHKRQVPPPLQQLQVDDHYGYWRVYGYGMICIFKSDFRKVGSFDKKRFGWGGEDLNFLRQITKAKQYKVIRTLDPGLFHLYHNKTCHSAFLRDSCSRSKANNEASKASLGLWYFKRKENMSVYGVLAEDNHPGPDYDLDQEAEARAGAEDGTPDLEAAMLVFLVLFNVLFFLHNYRRLREMSREKINA